MFTVPLPGASQECMPKMPVYKQRLRIHPERHSSISTKRVRRPDSTGIPPSLLHIPFASSTLPRKEYPPGLRFAAFRHLQLFPGLLGKASKAECSISGVVRVVVHMHKKILAYWRYDLWWYGSVPVLVASIFGWNVTAFPDVNEISRVKFKLDGLSVAWMRAGN
jgi:hypothetical protein